MCRGREEAPGDKDAGPHVSSETRFSSDLLFVPDTLEQTVFSWKQHDFYTAKNFVPI